LVTGASRTAGGAHSPLAAVAAVDGSKTEAGKARCSMNALKHGSRSQAKIREYQRIRYVLRLAAQNIALLWLHIRLHDARPRIKFKYPPSALPFRSATLKPTSPCGEVKPPERSEAVWVGGFRHQSGYREPQPWRFRPPRLGTRIGRTRYVHVFREEHRWPSASP